MKSLWLEDFLQDVRYGARTLRRAPVFTVLAIATLTLSIGANTAIFSLVDPLLFRSLPVRDAGRLVQFSWQYPGDPPLNLFGLEGYEQFRDRNTVFSDIAGVAPLATSSQTEGTQPITGEIVTGNFFQALGIRPALGRVLDTSDDRPGAAATAVVSWRYWQIRFNGHQRALGATVEVLDDRLPTPMHATVVGVTEPGFSGVTADTQPEVWLSLGAIPSAMRSRGGFALFAHLKSGVSIAQARAEMRVLDQPRIAGLAQRDPEWRHVAIEVTRAGAGLSTPLTDQFGGPLSLLMAFVGVLLLLACANVGGLLLARGAARQQEMAVRVSLGAGRLRIVRQVLTECLLLAAAGGLLGVMFAGVGSRLLLRIVTSGTRLPGGTPDLHVALDARVLLFTAVAMIGSALLFGLAPSVAAFRSPTMSAVRAGAGGTPSRSRRVFGNALVVAQVALSLSLVSVGELYVIHLAELRGHSLGFDRQRVLLLSVGPSDQRGRAERHTQYQEAMSRLEAIPGVHRVAASGMSPMSGAAGSRFVRVEGARPPPADRRRLSINTVTPHYFETYATPLVAGRDFREADALHPRRVIVNQAMARQYLAGREAIGQRIWFDDDRDPFEIIGVVGDAKYQDVRVAAPPTVYIYAQGFTGSAVLSLRTAGDSMSVAAAARQVLTEVFGARAVGRVTTLEAQVDASIVPERLIATLSGFFAAAGVLLASLGLYGLMTYTVERRAREIGVRMALGATGATVVLMVLRQALALVAIGVAGGAPLAVFGKRVAATMIEHLSPGGFVSVLIAAVGMLVLALIAAGIPAHRAARVDPIVALRAE